MAKKNPFETLSEEQKARQDEIRQQQRDQLATDIAASNNQLNQVDISTAARLANPEGLEQVEVVAYRNPKDAPQQESADQATTATPVTTATTATNPAPATQPGNIGQQMLEKDRAASLKPEKPLESPASLEPKDNEVSAVAQAYRDQARSIADILQAQKDEAARQEREMNAQVQADINASKWTGLTELASSIANMIGVGEGNAVSQQYAPQSQNWMQKADADMRERRNRISDLRQRQMETRAKMDQLRASNAVAMSKARMEYEQQRLANEYRKAQIAYQNAKTETERRQADAQIRAYEALAKQRESSAYSNVTRADAYADTSRQNAASRASSVANQNANRDITSAASANANNARAEKTRSDMGQTSGSGSNSGSKTTTTPGVTVDKNGLPHRKKQA